MKTKGFTLIEMLATVTVLVIILLIAAATINSVITAAKRGAYKANAQLILKSISNEMKNDASFDPFSVDESTITEKLGLEDENYEYLNISLYNNENYIFINGQNKWGGLTACGTAYNMKVVDSDDTSSCDQTPGFIVERTTDTTPGAFGGGDGSTCNLAYTVDSIEDLVYLSNQVNAGTNYSGKCIKLTLNLDFNSKRSYVDYARTNFGDINGNSSTEGLKTELTTAAGFKAIGDNTVSSHRFAGTFSGQVKTIYNLYVNRPTTDYIGLFGYVSAGKVTALNLNNLQVTGGNYTGGVAGFINNGSATEINILNGDVTAINYTGLVAGYLHNDGSGKIISVVVEGDVSGTNYVGGVLGYGYTYNAPQARLNAIYAGGAVTASGANVNRILGGEGKYYGCPYFAISSLAVSSLTTVNGSTVTSNSITSRQGSNINTYSELFTDINLAEVVFDTYISGDDDSNGYYWDYDGTGTVVRKTTSASPLTFDLSGAGTSGDPYLIADYDDLRKASLTQNVYYKMTADIDLTNQHFYMLSSYTNPTTGTFIGDTHTISNIEINAPSADYMGLFGYMNGGKVTTLNLDNPNLVAGNYTGGIVGYINNGSITEINISDANIVAGNYASMVAGYLYHSGSGRISSVVVEGDVTGADYVGGVVGYGYTYETPAAKLNAIYTSGAIISTGSNVNRIVGGEGNYYGCPYFAISSLAVSSLTTVNGSTVTSNSITSRHGSNIDTYNEVFTDINLAEVVFDTYISGDDDSNGYYWDYDGTGTVVRKTTSAFPLTFDLSGAGTSGNPYLIADYDDLRKASLIQDVYYKMTADIDLTGQHFYMLSSYTNPTTGTFIGDTNTISNIEIDAPSADYMGLFGYMNGGKVTTLNIDGLDIISRNYTGGIVGYIYNGSVSEISVADADIVAGNYTSMVAGYLYHDGSSRTTGIVVEGDVTGADYVGGVVGYGYTRNTPTGPVAAVNNGSAIIATGTNVNRIVGGEGNYYGCPYLAISSLATSSSTVNGLTVSSTYTDSRQGSDINTYNEIFANINLAEVVFDTYISGDDDSNGYYWDYDGTGTVVRKTTSAFPLTFDLSGAGTSGDPYLIANYADLRKASLTQNVYYKLTADIDLTGQRFYMLSSFLNQSNGTFIGDARTISNMVIDAPEASYIGLFGYMSGGSISGLKLIDININSRNYTGGLVGYINNGPITNSFVTGDIVAGDNVGLAVGYLYNDGSGQINGVIVEGDITGASNVGGIMGRGYTRSMSSGALNGINQGGAIIASGSDVNRIVGGEGKYTGSPYFSISSEALSSITINGSPVTSSLLTSRHGKDITSSDLLVDTTYTTIGFNFTNETLPYIWELYGASATFRKGTG